MTPATRITLPGGRGQLPRWCWALVLAAITPAPLHAENAFVIDKLLIGVHSDKTLDSPIVKVLPTGTALEVLKRDGDLAQIKGPEGITGWVDASYLTDEQPAAAVLEMLEAQNRQLVENLKNAEAKAAGDKAAATGKPDPGSTEQLEKLKQDNTSLLRSLNEQRQRVQALEGQVKTLTTPAPADSSVIDMLKRENAELKRALETTRAVAVQPPELAASPGTERLQDLKRALGRLTDRLGSRLGSPYVIAGILAALLLASFGAGAKLMDHLQRSRHGGFRL